MGWETVEVSRKDVPVQKASRDVPWRSETITYHKIEHYNGFYSGKRDVPTGKGTPKEVVSRAQTKFVTQRDPKAISRRCFPANIVSSLLGCELRAKESNQERD